MTLIAYPVFRTHKKIEFKKIKQLVFNYKLLCYDIPEQMLYDIIYLCWIQFVIV